jgi:hypothetical protein
MGPEPPRSSHGERGLAAPRRHRLEAEDLTDGLPADAITDGLPADASTDGLPADAESEAG